MSEFEPIVIATAGHVDHGKSSLVKVLTGIDPDRLEEEQRRQMTIDLGFAWFDTPAGRRVSVIDVPGHERFIRNMLAGVGGIDAALLVVAADEGPMPQTVEQLNILDLLGIERGVVALTKADLVDQSFIELVAEEVRELIRPTSLNSAPIIPISAVTGEGIPALLATIDQLPLDELAGRFSDRPRLPIDRVFTMSGFGTVVTGTLLDGNLKVGQDVQIYPGDRIARVRGLQSHGNPLESAAPGRRFAVNLAGIQVDEIERGDQLARPGSLQPASMIDAQLRLLPDSPVLLKQNDAVDFFAGSAHRPARITLLDTERLEPGGEGWVQIRLAAPAAAVEGDRFIIRWPSPAITIGGGRIAAIDQQRLKRFRPEVIAELEIRATGTPSEKIVALLDERPCGETELMRLLPAGIAPKTASTTIAELLARGDVVRLPGGALTTRRRLNSESDRIRAQLSNYHAAFPAQMGVSREQLRAERGSAGTWIDSLLELMQADGILKVEGKTIRLTEFQPQLPAHQLAAAEAFLTALRKSPVTPPPPSEFGLDLPSLRVLESQGEIVLVNNDFALQPETADRAESIVSETIRSQGSITLAEFRDQFGVTRKYAQPILEYFDQQEITRRQGDVRVLGPKGLRKVKE